MILLEDLPKIPFLAFVRRFGWVVVEPKASWRATDSVGFYTRPARLEISRHHILAAAPLPSVPPEAS